MTKFPIYACPFHIISVSKNEKYIFSIIAHFAICIYNIQDILSLICEQIYSALPEKQANKDRDHKINRSHQSLKESSPTVVDLVDEGGGDGEDGADGERDGQQAAGRPVPVRLRLRHPAHRVDSLLPHTRIFAHFLGF